MWSDHRQREESDARLERHLAAFDSQIADIEASSAANTPYWDGYCGLVKVCDEDLVRRDAAPRHAALAAAIQQHGEQQQQQLRQQQVQGEHHRGKHQQLQSEQRRGEHAGSTAVSSSAQTPLTGSPRGSVGSAASPFKAAPAALPHSQQPAAVLAEQAAAALQQRRPHDAEALLHLALEKCATQDTQLATQVVDLLLSCEREWHQAPSGADSSGGSEEATALLRSALQALGSAPSIKEREAEQARQLLGKNLVVQVLQARRLQAADSNGYSDPYCVVRVGGHKASSKTELKTLEPRWNETFVFRAADVATALEDGRSFVSFRVFDWDLVSADDFLGQCEVHFADLAPQQQQQGPAQPRWLPLYGFDRGGQKADAGDIQVAVWFEAEGVQQDQQEGATAMSTLCSPPGTRKQVPLVVHSARGVLYEEPLVACLAVTLDCVQVLGHSSAGGSGSLGGADSRSEASFDLANASPMAPSSSGGTGTKLFNRLFHRKRRTSSSASGDERSHRASRSFFNRGSGGYGMLAGEDQGDEYSDFDFYNADGDGGGEDNSMSFDDSMSLDGSVPRHQTPGYIGHPTRYCSSLDDCLESEQPSVLKRPSASFATVREEEEAQEEGARSGKRTYVRLVLGRQKQTSWIKREGQTGAAHWHQTFVFAVPLPLRDRQLRIEVYRTSSNTQKGRLSSMTNVWVQDLVPAQLAHDPEACKRVTLELQGALKSQPAGRIMLRSTLVDTDVRRSMYQAPLAEEEEEEEAQQPGGGGTGPRLQRLESSTEGYSTRELARKALHSEASFSKWRGGRRRRARQHVSGLVPTAVEMAQSSWLRVSSYFSGVPADAAAADDDADGGSEGEEGLLPQLAPKLPEPAGTLSLTVQNIKLCTAPTSDGFFVLKCGPHWGRSRTLSMAGRTSVECGWSLCLPILDPTVLLTLVLFQHTRMKATEKLRPGFLPTGSAGMVVGKLRVRLSCLRPNTPITADLVLLGERSKGGDEAGSVELALKTSYASPGAMFRGYKAPVLPSPAYAHGLDDRQHQKVMSKECRRIVLRWLDSANPSIANVEALAVLDADREVFAQSRVRVNIRRIRMALMGVRRFHRKFEAIKTWQEPWQSVAAMLGACFLCFAPRLAIPLLLAWVVFSTLAAQPEFEEGMLSMEQDPPDIEPENERLETTTVNPVANLRAKVERLQRMGLLVQNVLGEVASFMERVGALLSWHDPAATAGVLCVLSAVALLIYFLGPAVVTAFAICFVIRPPALRTPTPPLPAIVFGKLPTRGDRIV
ncbi:hypothetical protein D9Q98_006208 [Chlorella vulgaris]|uniref:C2 domain-containing protein n=1 Tax=Chlorella vulgaris TaxID=3077 RepID=A0A9D4Z1B8_CHLVU|nr:hypothetical protein D9Q98_006208 [Chlorella vulgaris]